jgi:hypothetical protein
MSLKLLQLSIACAAKSTSEKSQLNEPRYEINMPSIQNIDLLWLLGGNLPLALVRNQEAARYSKLVRLRRGHQGLSTISPPVHIKALFPVYPLFDSIE